MIGPRALLALTLVLSACNNSSFTGGATAQPGVAQAPKSDPIKIPPTPPANTTVIGSDPSNPGRIVVPTDCGAAGATQARLLTPDIDVTATGAHLEYEVYRTDCDGVIQAFVADKILFDMDAFGAYSDMDATLTQDGIATPTVLKLTLGSDLFGHIGDTWGHQETTNKIATSGSSKSVRLRIELADRSLTPRDPPVSGPAADGSLPIPTFLRFGDAAPIQVDVKAFHTAPAAKPLNSANTNSSGTVVL